jgi:hypothetical protein
MVIINQFLSLIKTVIIFRLGVLTSMNAAEEISEEQARQFQMDLEICYNDFSRLLSTNG